MYDYNRNPPYYGKLTPFLTIPKSEFEPCSPLFASPKFFAQNLNHEMHTRNTAFNLTWSNAGAFYIEAFYRNKSLTALKFRASSWSDFLGVSRMSGIDFNAG